MDAEFLKRVIKMPQLDPDDKFFIMSTEFDQNISDWRHDYTDYKNDLDFFFKLVKWPKIAVKKSQNFQKF